MGNTQAASNLYNKKSQDLVSLIDELKEYKFPMYRREVFEGGEEIDIDKIRIAFIGTSGSGKSSVINLIVWLLTSYTGGPFTSYSVVNSNGTEGTQAFDEFLLKFGFNIFDTIGYDNYDVSELKELSSTLAGNFYAGMKAHRELNAIDTVNIHDQQLDQCIHGTIIVARATDPRLINGEYLRLYQQFKNNSKDLGITPIVFLTHCDIADRDKVQQAKQRAIDCFGSSDENTICVCAKNNSISEADQFKLLIGLKNTLIHAEKFIRHTINRRKNNHTRIIGRPSAPLAPQSTVDNTDSSTTGKSKSPIVCTDDNGEYLSHDRLCEILKFVSTSK
jgi:putative ribosome biogenesis GTPase RsgA